MGQSATIAFDVILTGSIFAYGRVVQLRAQRARRANTSETEPQATDAGLGTRIVADERARLGGQSLGLLRTAVEGMRSDAPRREVELDASLIESVCQRGRQAVTELRWLLGALRSEPGPTPRRNGPISRGRVVNIVSLTRLLVAVPVEVWFQAWEQPTPLAWALAVASRPCGRLMALHPLACAMRQPGAGRAPLTGSCPPSGTSSASCCSRGRQVPPAARLSG